MDRTEGFGAHMDKTLRKIQAAYLEVFVANEIPLTIEQWVILQRIYLLGPNTSQTEVSKSNYRNRATTSRVIGGLCKKGLVLKDRFDGDHKRYRLRLTAEGEAVMEKARPLVTDLRERAAHGIDPKEFTVFLKVLDAIWENYDSMD